MKLKKYLGGAALALAAMTCNGASTAAQVLPPATFSKNPTVAIGASAFEEAAPDSAIIDAGLVSNDPSSKDAAAKNNREFAQILAVVKKYGIAAADIRTTGVSVRPNYIYPPDGSGEQLDGYIASNSVAITVRDLTKISAMLGDLGEAGANSISGPTFYLEDNEALMDKAREQAFDKAQRQAMTYARKAGFKSVRLLTINENAGDMAYSAAAYAGAAAAADAASSMKLEIAPAPVEPGLVSETVYASFLFEMVP